MVKRRVRRKQGGDGFMDVLKKANNFLKKTKIISTIGKAYGATGAPGAAIVGRVGNTAGALGYGKRRRKRGGCKNDKVIRLY